MAPPLEHLPTPTCCETTAERDVLSPYSDCQETTSAIRASSHALLLGVSCELSRKATFPYQCYVANHKGRPFAAGARHHSHPTQQMSLCIEGVSNMGTPPARKEPGQSMLQLACLLRTCRVKTSTAPQVFPTELLFGRSAHPAPPWPKLMLQTE